jgi:hypothetical protein
MLLPRVLDGAQQQALQLAAPPQLCCVCCACLAQLSLPAGQQLLHPCNHVRRPLLLTAAGI